MRYLKPVIEDKQITPQIMLKAKRDYRVIINVMTYQGDQEILEYCLRSVIKVFENNPLEIYIMDDSNKPMEEKYVEKMKALSPCVKYEKTHFERNRNLNGKTCVVGMIEKFIEHANGRDALNIKIDPDTIVCHKEVFDEIYNAPNAAYAATSRPGCHFSGILYCFRTEPLVTALELVKSFPVPESRGPEDYIIGLAISAASLPKLSLQISTWNDKAKEGVTAAWNYRSDLRFEAIHVYYSLFQFITMGNWFMQGAATKLTPSSRLAPAELLVKYIEAQKDNQ